LQQSPSVLPRWDKAAAVVEAAAERPEVPVALVEQQAQLAQRQQAPPMWYDDWQRRELERYWSTPWRQHNE
jgi:hypothetical protein